MSNKLWIRKCVGSIQYRKNNPSHPFGGEIHREDGPAIIWDDGQIFWYLNDVLITETVNTWINEHNYPEWKNENSWDDAIKFHFKLAFVGA